MLQFFRKYRPWFIWLLAAAFFLSEYFARVAPSVMAPNLMQAFHANAFAFGTLSAMFYYAYIPMQIPVGAMMDALSTRRLLTITALICGISTLIFCLTNSLAIAMLMRFLLGFGAAFAFVGALKLAYTWFPASKFGFLAGTTQALGMLGAAIGEGPVSIIVEKFGWQTALQLIAGFLIVLALLIFLVVRDKEKKNQNLTVLGGIKQAVSGLIQVIKNPALWINGLFIGFLYAPTQTFAELWGPSYIHNVYHVPRQVAAGSISLIFIGWAIGGPLSGLISDRIKKRKPILWASAFLSFLFMSLVLYLPHLSKLSLFTLLFCYGLSNVGVATSYVVAAEISPKLLAGTAMGFANMASIALGAVFQPLVGKLLDVFGHDRVINGVHVYSAGDYRLAMLTLPLCFVVCLVACFFIKESYPQT